jgi:hypothetical protein
VFEAVLGQRAEVFDMTDKPKAVWVALFKLATSKATTFGTITNSPRGMKFVGEGTAEADPFMYYRHAYGVVSYAAATEMSVGLTRSHESRNH